jgi:hypothetical protein
MGLVTYADLQASSKSNPSLKVYQAVKARIHDSMRPMPSTGLLPAAELSTLDDWVAGGAPNCGFPTMLNPMMPSGTGGGDPADATECYEFRAHNLQTPGDTTKFEVRAGEFYENFVFKAPYDHVVYGVSFQPIIDNAAVLHHWLGFEVVKGTVGADGSHADSLGNHPNSVIVAGWAPGGTGVSAPDGVDFQMPPPGGQFEVEFHYFNNTGATVQDASGLRFCVTSTPRPNTASITSLGTENIFILPNTKSTATGTCTPKNPNKQDIHILRVSPHMHKLGTHMTTIINRADGGQETLYDGAFAFSDQRSYSTPNVVHPGDTLTTTCTYENAPGVTLFGTSTTSEMCYNFVAAYPALALSNPGNSLEASQDTCLQ